MRPCISWSDELDGQLRALRESGMTWDRIASEMGLGRNTVLERARRIGARTRRLPAPVILPEPKDRPPRQAGHPQTWALLTAGTLLDGEHYPFPVFL